MVEADYAVDEYRQKLVDPHILSVDDILQIKSQGDTPSEVMPNHTRKSSNKQKQKVRNNRLPMAKCPNCDIMITRKGLPRHIREKHLMMKNSPIWLKIWAKS